MKYINNFPMTLEGYKAAKEWLITNKLWENIKDQDGYSVVYYANHHNHA